MLQVRLWQLEEMKMEKINRREFFGVSAAVAGTAVVGTAVARPRKFVRNFEDRGAPDPDSLWDGVIRLYHRGKLVVETPTSMEQQVEGTDVVVGKGDEVVITSKKTFSFDKVTIELAGIPKEYDLPLTRSYTVTTGNTLTLQADSRGMARVKRW